MSSKLKGDLAPKSNKNPYELRLEILHLAQHIIDRENENRLALLHLQNEQKNGVSRSEEGGFQCTEDKILSVAKKLNNFVSNG